MEKLGFPGESSGQPPLPSPVAGVAKLPRQAQSHPLKFVSAIIEGPHIYEHTTVWELADTTVSTDREKVRVRKIIVTAHFPFLDKHDSYFLRLYQHRSYVIVLEGTPDVDGMYADEFRTGLSSRNHGNPLLIGDGSRCTGKQGGDWRKLRAFTGRHCPHAAEEFHRTTQDCTNLDGVPYIDSYSVFMTNLYVAAGFDK